jgi:hypothetical protein
VRTSSGARTEGTVLGSVSGGPMPGPRKEYLEVFDALEAEEAAAKASAGAPVDGPGGDGGRGAPAIESGSGSRAAAGGDGHRSAGSGSGSGSRNGTGSGHGTRDARRGGRGGSSRADQGGRGRTFAGIAAAAVTTVLAVVVAGQVAHGPRDGGSPQTRRGADRSRDDAAPEPAGRAGSRAHPTPLSYDQKMTMTYPLDPKLRGSGAFTTIGGRDAAPGSGQVLRYRVDVEQGLHLDSALFAQAVQKTLNDDRSWAHGGTRTFERVSTGRADFVISLASPGTTATWCAKSGLDTGEENVSCDSASTDHVMINAYRWAQGAKTYGGDKMYPYRQMLINHEVGHRLGHNHELCPRQGALAPVMMQQTKFLTMNGVTCRPNPWPYPQS